MNEKRRALGRGLGALIPSSPHGAGRPTDVFFHDHARPGMPSGEQGPAGAPASGGVGLATRPDDGSAAPGRHGLDHGGDSGTSADFLDHADVGHADTVEAGDATGLAPVPGARFAEVPVGAIRPNPKQPRTIFDEDELSELAHSIAEIGVLQPVVVRPVGDDADVSDGVEFELVMGERRWRATQLAGLETIPAIIKETQDDALLRDALLENLHRSNLNPLEEAAAYQQLLDDFGCSHEELATRIGRSRPQISNTLRLLRLPPLVARRLAAGVLSAGHARALLSLDDAAAIERLAQRIVAEGLSVRNVEEIVAVGGDAAPRVRRLRAGTRHPQLDDVAARLCDHLDTRVTIALGQRKGKLTVEFASVEDLDRIVKILGLPSERVLRE